MKALQSFTRTIKKKTKST